jgi:hypothetical protein
VRVPSRVLSHHRNVFPLANHFKTKSTQCPKNFRSWRISRKISSRRERSLRDEGLNHIILIVEGFFPKTFNMKGSG